MLFKLLKSKRGNSNAPTALLCFGLRRHISSSSMKFGRHMCKNATYLEHSCRKINILPLQGHEFPFPHTSCQGQDKQCLQTMANRSGKESLALLLIQRLNFIMSHPRRINIIAYIPGNETPSNGFLQSQMQHFMKTGHGCWGESLLQFLRVASLQVLWCQFLKLVVTNPRHKMQADYRLVPLIGTRAHRVFMHIL